MLAHVTGSVPFHFRFPFKSLSSQQLKPTFFLFYFYFQFRLSVYLSAGNRVSKGCSACCLPAVHLLLFTLGKTSFFSGTDQDARKRGLLFLQSKDAAIQAWIAAC